MNVILKENVKNLGTIGDIVKVKSGYARNFLIPNKLAIIASEKQVKQVEHHKRALAAKLAKVKQSKEGVRAEIEALTLTIRRKAGEDDKLFGSVTNKDIHEALVEKGYNEIDRKQIELEKPIKKLGAHKVPCKLMEGVVAELNVAVVTEI